MCYECEDATTAEECDRRQKTDICSSSEQTCLKVHYKKASGKTVESRGCSEKSACEEVRRKCESGVQIEQNDGDPITKCEVACCVTANGADEPCNEACANSVNMMLMAITMAILCVLK